MIISGFLVPLGLKNEQKVPVGPWDCKKNM